MTDLNHVDLIGRLTRDAELASISTGTSVCKFSIAVNRSKKVGDSWEDEPSFFNIVLWGRQGEALNQYLVKGKQVGVSGELRQERWQQDGQNRSKIEIIANSVQLLGGGNNDSRNSGGSNGRSSDYDNGRYNSRQQKQAQSANGNTSPGTAYSVSEDGFQDDIPF